MATGDAAATAVLALAVPAHGLLRGQRDAGVVDKGVELVRAVRLFLPKNLIHTAQASGQYSLSMSRA